MEWLGVGVWGSKKAAPFIEASEFAAALVAVVGVDDKNLAERNARIQKAKELQNLTAKNGGRARAAELIAAEVRSE